MKIKRIKSVLFLMQGYILNINLVKDEDLIVTILTPKKIKTLYRFYGARHSTIQLGYQLDFASIASNSSNIPQLREVLHLASSWLHNNRRFFIWQQFIKLLFTHLKDVQELDTFYFLLLEKMNHKFEKQNPKRVVVESYIEILNHEGRVHNDFICFICEEEIEAQTTLARALLPAHSCCVMGKEIKKEKIQKLFKTNSTLFLEDDEVDYIWQIIQLGF
jgi:recombinational DNA repair protein (RecF pathway)